MGLGQLVLTALLSCVLRCVESRYYPDYGSGFAVFYNGKCMAVVYVVYIPRLCVY